MKHKFRFEFLLLLFLPIFFAGCIRLWGGATYVKDQPGDYEERTYILDSGQIGKPSGDIH